VTFVSEVGAESDQAREVVVRGHAPEVKCYSVRKCSIKVASMLYIFAGLLHKELSRNARFMHESGILKMYNNFAHITGIAAKRKAALMDEKDKEPTPFQMGDWKILSIFVVWATLLATSSIIFALELFHLSIRNLFKSTKFAFIRLSVTIIRWQLRLEYIPTYKVH